MIARNSTFTYKGKPVKAQQLAQELGVRYVLDGSVRKVLNQVRINAQLIDAGTGHHLWAERYDGKMDDIFALEDGITQKIVAAPAVKLTLGEGEQSAIKETNSIEAYDALLQGWEFYQRQTPDDFAKALPYFHRAIELDSNYGRAYAALALTYLRASDYGWVWSMRDVDPSDRIRAEQYLEEALKNRCIILAHTQLRIHHIIRDIICQIARRHRAAKVPHIQVFVMPIPDKGLVHLAQDYPVLTINTVEFLVGPGAQVGIMAARVNH